VSELLVMSEKAVRRALPLDELAESLIAALISLAEGTASVPPRIAAHSQEGLLGAMPGYVPGLGLAGKLVSVYPANPQVNLPAHQALIAVFDEATGIPVAVMDGTYITAMRTAMTSALAARALAGTRRQSLALSALVCKAKPT
jgi:ornithine cyclodeaminase/alanine dehydrogenase-like protein (mu-crystallin family)